MKPPLVRGGQGRSSAEVAEQGGAVAACAACLAVLLLALWVFANL